MDMGLERLNRLLLEMASISESAVTASINAYQKGEKGVGVRETASKLRALHHQVSELSMEMIARYQPVASDLRFIKACMEISYGFFRYGRYARDIVEVLEMFGELSTCDHKAVVDTAKKTQEMMRMSIDAFDRRDVELARSIRGMDDAVDERYRENLEEGHEPLDRPEVRPLGRTNPPVPRTDIRPRCLHRRLGGLHRDGRRASDIAAAQFSETRNLQTTMIPGT